MGPLFSFTTFAKTFNMRHILFVFVFLCPASILHAQYDDLLQKRRYSWVAEHTTDYELNPQYSDLVEVEMNLAQVVRLQNPQGRNELFPELEVPHYLSAALLQGLQAGHFTCFADEQLTQPLPHWQVDRLLNQRDTIVTAADEPFSVVVSPLPARDLDLFRVRQVLFFDARKKAFGARLLAIAPMVNLRDGEGNFIGRKPLLWIKIPDQRNCQTRKIARAANYVVQTFLRETALDPDHLKAAKGRLDLRKWAANEVRRPAHKTLDYTDFRVLNPAQLRAQIIKNDTLVVFAPDTFMETAVVVQEDATERVEKIRLVQNWYYDARRHRLASKLVAVAPLAAVRDADGYLRYYKPLFYSKY